MLTLHLPSSDVVGWTLTVAFDDAARYSKFVTWTNPASANLLLIGSGLYSMCRGTTSHLLEITNPQINY
jgi:hypothetical protein